MAGIVILITGICLVVLKPVSEVLYQVGTSIWFLGIATFTTMDTCLNLFAADQCLFFQAMLVQMISYTVLYAYNGKPGMLVALLFLLYALVCQRWIRNNAEVEGSYWPRFTTMMTIWGVLYLSVGFGANDLYLLYSGNVELRSDASTSKRACCANTLQVYVAEYPAGLYITMSLAYIIGEICATLVFILTQRLWEYDATRALYAKAFTSFFNMGFCQFLWGSQLTVSLIRLWLSSCCLSPN